MELYCGCVDALYYIRMYYQSVGLLHCPAYYRYIHSRLNPTYLRYVSMITQGLLRAQIRPRRSAALSIPNQEYYPPNGVADRMWVSIPTLVPNMSLHVTNNTGTMLTISGLASMHSWRGAFPMPPNGNSIAAWWYICGVPYVRSSISTTTHGSSSRKQPPSPRHRSRRFPPCPCLRPSFKVPSKGSAWSRIDPPSVLVSEMLSNHNCVFQQ